MKEKRRSEEEERGLGWARCSKSVSQMDKKGVIASRDNMGYV